MSLSVLEVVVDGNDSVDPAALDWPAVIATEKLALASAVRQGDWMSQGYSHLALGLAARALGDHKRARQQVAEGTYILRALGINLVVPG
ncbi:hypothetical protein [Streptomyces sp. SID13031]|uniref:hypothetical protein n=1 Tax=Streptomyces sp. SID13031 TaxID=2706046 RepID=UPI0013CD08A3|nr:hypothetical protein [Streptomyces sp. SID13031]NEA37529.1 hypothetical protein [Streptomyces sp. SID13031]